VLVCTACLGDPPGFEWVPVGGRGELVTWTVVHDAFLPGFAALTPYVVGEVRLDEADDLRLVTRIVGIEPEELRIGTRLAVGFADGGEGTSVPFFQPADDPEARAHQDSPPLPPRPAIERGRPHFGASGKVAIVGYAHSPIARRCDVTLGTLTLRTVLEAIADAGLARDQIDGYTTGALFPSSSGLALRDGVEIVTADWVAEHLGVQPRWLNGFQGIGQICGSVALATDAIASGAADYVVLHRAMYNPPVRYHANAMTHASGANQWSAPFGYWGPPTHMALAYTEYQQRYGATREHMATVAVSARQAGALIPWSHWHDRPITRDEYLESRIIAEPMSVLDCDIPVTGVGAFVLTSAERAADLPHKPVYVAGYAQGHSRRLFGAANWTLDDIQRGGREVASVLWDNCGFGPDDVDVPQVYDAFSPFVYFWLEALGFCGEGEAFELVQDLDRLPGVTYRSGGGAMGNGRMHGVPQMLECYLQLSGRAGDRQLAKAETAFACQAAPNIGGVVAYST